MSLFAPSTYLCIIGVSLLTLCNCKSKGLTAPPMGWSSWYAFGGQINETVILQTAHKLLKEGFLDAGYEYVNLDDAWSAPTRDKYGRLYGDPIRFPHGMRWLADQLHAMGFKFGLYGNAAPRTCMGYPGQFEHEYLDAQTFAEWTVDFFKYDNCNHKWANFALNIRGASFEGQDAHPIADPSRGAWGDQGEVLPWYPLPAENGSFAPRLAAGKFQIQEVEAYKLMSQALEATNRSIVYSICPRIAGCDPSIYEFYADVADTVMNQCPQHDVRDAWEGDGRYGQNNPNSSISWHIDNYVDYSISRSVRSGYYHDNDFLLMGWKTISDDCSEGQDGYCPGQSMSFFEYRSQVSMYALMMTPLIFSADIRGTHDYNIITDEMKAVYLNPEIIAINQQPFLGAAIKVSDKEQIQIFLRPLINKQLAVAILNRASTPALNIVVSFSAVGVPLHWRSVAVRDVWQRVDLGLFEQQVLLKELQSHDTAVLVLSQAHETQSDDSFYV